MGDSDVLMPEVDSATLAAQERNRQAFMASEGGQKLLRETVEVERAAERAAERKAGKARAEPIPEAPQSGRSAAAAVPQQGSETSFLRRKFSKSEVVVLADLTPSKAVLAY